jgi:hypothetical protein
MILRIRRFLHLFGIHWWKYHKYSGRSCRLCPKKQFLLCLANNEPFGGYSDYEWRDI